MKKLLTLLLTLAIIFAFSVPSFAEAENFASDCVWEQGVLLAKSDFTVTDGVCVAKNIDAEYRSPVINILPAIKAALGDGDEVSLILTYEMRVTMATAGAKTTARPLLRGVNALTDLAGADNVEDWIEAYEESLDGDSAFFSNSNGNIMRAVHDPVELVDGEWTEVTIELDLTSAQVLSPAVAKWNLCADKIINFANIKTLEYRNLSIVLADEAEDTETPAEKPAEKPEEKPEEKPQENKPATEATPAPTKAPAAPTEAPTEVPDTNNGNGNDGTVITVSAIICGVIIICAIAACVVVKKKIS